MECRTRQSWEGSGAWYGQSRFWEKPVWFRRKGIGKGLAEPLDGLGKAKVAQVDRQADATAAAKAADNVGREPPYPREGPKLTMKWQGAGMTTGTIAGNTFTMNNEGMELVYKK